MPFPKRPIATFELQFEVGDILLKQRFIVTINLTNTLLGLHFLQKNMRQGVLNFPFFSMQLKHADNTYSNNEELFLNPTDILIQPNKQTNCDFF